jgi:hypothetical protein
MSRRKGQKGTGTLELNGKEITINGKLIRIAFIDGEGFQFLDDPLSQLEALRNGPRIDLFTFIQRLSDTAPRYSYPMELDNMAALRVTTFDDWMTKQINSKVRNMVRKAGKNGVVVREAEYDEAYVQGIQAIYNEAPVRQGKPFWHYGKDLEAVRKMNGTFLQRSIFIGAYLEEKLIGFVKLVFDEEKSQAGLMQIVSMIGHQDKAPTNALIAQAVQSCADRGISYLWYANMSYGKKQADGLADFKRHNGFQKIEVPRYYVPLTLAGKLALRLNLHHGLSELIPEPIAATYRKIRKQWYGKKVASAKNAEQKAIPESGTQP